VKACTKRFRGNARLRRGPAVGPAGKMEQGSPSAEFPLCVPRKQDQKRKLIICELLASSQSSARNVSLSLALRTLPALASMAVELGERLLVIALAGLRAAGRQYAKTMAALSSKEFLEDGGRSRRDFFVGKELRADQLSGFRGVNADDIGEQAEVVDVPGPGGEGLHRGHSQVRSRCFQVCS